MINEFAPAKINLCLHVTGQNRNGYHELDSLVLFTTFGDRISVSQDKDWTLKLSGPYGQDIPQGAENLVWRAAEMTNPGRGGIIQLEKNLPPAAGIGGGSSDAAAVIRALSKLYPNADGLELDLTDLGADVPVCMSAELTRMGGIGEKLISMGPPPLLPIVMVNPGVALNTAEVFQALEQKENPVRLLHDSGAVDQRNFHHSPWIQKEIRNLITQPPAQDALRRTRGSDAVQV